MTRRSGYGHEAVWSMAGGVVAMGVMVGAMMVSKALGVMRLDFGRMLGTVVMPDSGEARTIGWGLNFVNGAAIALAYRQAFRWLGMWPGAASGALLGLAHAVGAMAFVAAAPYIHPRPKQAGLRKMGPFAYGPLTVPGMVLGHALFGAIVGWFIGREPRREYYVNRAFLRWLARQEEADHVEAHPVPITPRLRAVPAAYTQSEEPTESARAA